MERSAAKSQRRVEIRLEFPSKIGQTVAVRNLPIIWFVAGFGLLAEASPKAESGEKTVRIDSSKFSEIYPAVWFNPANGKTMGLEKRSEMPTKKKFMIWIEPGDPEFVPGKGVTGFRLLFAGYGAGKFTNPKGEFDPEATKKVFSSESYEAEKRPVLVIEYPGGKCAVMFTAVDRENSMMEFRWKRLE